MGSAIKKLYEWLYSLLKTFDVSQYIGALQDTIGEYIGWINWIIPFNRIAIIYTTWLACIGAYFIFVHVKPFIVKLIEQILKKGD